METITPSNEHPVSQGPKKVDEMSEVRFLQRLMLATPLYFYYHNLTPPGYFSNLLKAFVQLQKVDQSNSEEQPPSSPVAGGSNSISEPRAPKRKLISMESPSLAKTKRPRLWKGNPFPRIIRSPEPPQSTSPWQRVDQPTKKP